MAAIPDTGGAWCAPRGVMRALLRLVVLAGLVLAGWLLGSGISHADEDLGQPDDGLVRLVSDRLDRAAGSDARPGGRLGVPSTVRSTVKKTVKKTLSTAPLPRLPVPPPVKVDVPKPLASSLEPVARTVSGLVPATRPQTPADNAAAVAPAAPAVRAMAAPAPMPAAQPATAPIFGPVTGPPTGSATGPTRALAHTRIDYVPLTVAFIATTDTPGELPVPGNGPAAPLPASPPATTTAPSLTGSSGGGAGSKGIPIVAVNDPWAMTTLTPTHRLRYLEASDLPRSPAAEPSTSPD